MGFFDNLKVGLEKTRKNFTEKIEQLVIGYAIIDDEFLDDLEAVLISADVGIQTTMSLMADIKKGIKDKEINGPEDLEPFLQTKISAMLSDAVSETKMATNGPTVIVVVGVNGVGKTTTIGKLAQYYRERGLKVMLAAADTFRAAAIDQLEIWGQRAGAEVIKHNEGSDPSAVAFDAVQSAKAKKVDLLIIDTEVGYIQNPT